MYSLVNKSKIVFLAFTKPYLQLFLQLPFSWQKSCVVAWMTHAPMSTLLNSTNEANTFLTMYNIIRFSRLLKLVSSILNMLRSWKLASTWWDYPMEYLGGAFHWTLPFPLLWFIQVYMLNIRVVSSCISRRKPQ